MTKKLLSAALLSAVALTSLPSSAAVHRTEFQDYIAPAGDAATGFCGSADEPGINVVCFDVLQADDRLRVTVTDAAFSRTGFLWVLEDAAGNCVGEDPNEPLAECENFGFACNQFTIASLPDATRGLIVYLDGPVAGAIDCEPGNGGAVLGEVKVEFIRD